MICLKTDYFFQKKKTRENRRKHNLQRIRNRVRFFFGLFQLLFPENVL